MDHKGAPVDKVRLEWRRQLDWLEIFFGKGVQLGVSTECQKKSEIKIRL